MQESADAGRVAHAGAGVFPGAAVPAPSAGAVSVLRRLGRAVVSLLRFMFHASEYAAGLLLGGVLMYEAHTSVLQARWFSGEAAQATYSLGVGPSAHIAFPSGGPFDEHRGYSRIPEFQARLEQRGYHVTRQAEVAPELQRLVSLSVNPPYPEPPTVGLTLRARDGTILSDASGGKGCFADFADVPPLLVTALLFIENRELLSPFRPTSNPVIEWDRLAKAGFGYAGRRLGLELPREGGSTLATQIEKYRHSPHGLTQSVGDKLRQILSASLKAYREGEDTLPRRREIVVEYLNTVPLAAAPGVGEVYGLAAGLDAWFGMDLADVSRALSPEGPPAARARAFKHALALLAAARAPSEYLVDRRAHLERRADAYLDLLRDQGLVDGPLAASARATPLSFAERTLQAAPASFVDRKALNALRNNLAAMLGVPRLYDVGRMHLVVDATAEVGLQRRVTETLRHLKDSRYLDEHGLRGPRLIGGGDPKRVLYSVLLYERTPEGNLARVQADNLEAPFDINSGIKMELGSTAKLRTLAHYLEVVVELQREWAGRERTALRNLADSARDPISRWVAEELFRNPSVDRVTLLEHALDRRYSGSPGEGFFTGGGKHFFANFSRGDNGRLLRLREALWRSTNLVFIRLMRDLVRFHEARLPYDGPGILANPDHPLRAGLLEESVNAEASRRLTLAYSNYFRQPRDELVRRLLGQKASSPRHLAILYHAWIGNPDEAGLADWLAHHLGRVNPAEVRRLRRAYGNPALTLADYAYLLGVHPLDLWAAGEYENDPDLSRDDLVARSAEARRVSFAWLYKPRNRKAQDLRLRIRVERDAFERMTPYWRRLGFPFQRLVPSLATAIGNSSDRPAALADLMGIIVNEGRRRPLLHITRLHFAAGTPYETVMEPALDAGEQVMDPAVAAALRRTLAGVIESGTAKPLRGVFTAADGTPLVVGGKTGSGDNRFKTFYRGGRARSARAVNRTATFVFYLGDRYFGVVTAYVPGRDAERYRFTSALPLRVLKLLAPEIGAVL